MTKTLVKMKNNQQRITDLSVLVRAILCFFEQKDRLPCVSSLPV